MLFPRAAAMFCIMPIVGRLYNFISPRILIGFGMAVLAWSFWGLGHLSLGMSTWTFAPLLAETGIGVGCSMVILSTVSLSSMPAGQHDGGCRPLHAGPAGLGKYRLRGLGDPDRARSQIHRAQLAGNINSLSPALNQFDAGANAQLSAFGYGSPTFRMRNLAMVNGILNRQSTLMAYNDTYTLLAWLFILALPMTLLLPRRGIPVDMAGAKE